jgi:hypothetical protein
MSKTRAGEVWKEIKPFALRDLLLGGEREGSDESLYAILLYRATYKEIMEYSVTNAGLSAALASASSGDVVWIPAGTISGDHTVPSGVEVVGAGPENTKLSGTITNNGILSFIQVTGTLNNSGTLRWVVDTNGYLQSNERIGVRISPRASVHADSPSTHCVMRVSSPDGNDATIQFYTRDGTDYEGWAVMKDREVGDFEIHWDDTESIEAHRAFIIDKGDYVVEVPFGIKGLDEQAHFNKSSAWVASFFDEDDESLHIWYTLDAGENWTDLGVSYGDTVRDPSIIFYRGKWWVAHTHNGAPTDVIPVLSSEDLKTWSSVVELDTSTMANPGAFAWAPEWFVDDDDSVHLFIACGDANKQIYETHPTNDAWTTWSNLTAVTGTSLPTDMIDANVVKIGPHYYLWFKDDATGYLCLARSTSLTSGYIVLKTGNWAGFGASKEGQILVRVNAGLWRIYYNPTLTNGQVYSESDDDFESWTTPASVSDLSGMSHGAIVPCTDPEAFRSLINALGLVPDHDHSGDSGDGGTFDAANLTSGSATDGQVLTADGAGGAAWEDASGGGGEKASDLTTYMEPVTNGDVNNPELVFAGGDVIMAEVSF